MDKFLYTGTVQIMDTPCLSFNELRWKNETQDTLKGKK